MSKLGTRDVGMRHKNSEKMASVKAGKANHEVRRHERADQSMILGSV